MFDLAVEEIYSIERWAHIVYVSGQGVQFFAARFYQSPSIEVLHNWGESIGLIKFAFNEDTLQRLRQNYRQKQLVVIGH